MPEPQLERGILDTSVVIDLERLERSALPREVAVTSITMAELAAGPHATADAGERARRQDRLQRAEAAFDPIPFDGSAARAYGRIFAAVVAHGRTARGARTVDLLIAAIAAATELPLWTRNPDELTGLDGLVSIVAV
jgi:predicted nucleic acid-binding protein